MEHPVTPTATTADPAAADSTAFKVIAALGFCHLLNDMMQSLLTALYPMLKSDFGLDFGQIGLLTLTFNVTASLLQPVVGLYTDKRPMPYSLSLGMGFTLIGLILLAFAHHYWLLLVASALVGMGSAVFHPEASRIARTASGGRHGLAQSLFQVGGNFGSAIGPLLAAFIVLPKGQSSVAWFSLAALLAMVVLWQVGGWYARHRAASAKRPAAVTPIALSPNKIILALVVLGVLVFSKYVYMASLTSYYTFYLIHKFDLSVRDSQLLLFLFLGAVAVGTIVGGPIGDRFGRKLVIWGSILGALPFTLALPYADLAWTAVLTVLIGLIMASAFSAIIVFAQELVPGKVGLIAGLFFGFAFGIGGIGAAVLGALADVKGIDYVYWICSFLPLVGLLTIFLPDMAEARAKARRAQPA
ncbi:MAG: MFS transporter [Rhizobiales bacterium]|nr:MFS transporter [Hyphomicrobiales bacterium]